MYNEDIDKQYVSEIDKFLYKFDQTHQKSAAQQKEFKKHARIAQLRDGYDAHSIELTEPR